MSQQLIQPEKTALLVIDVQNEYFDGKWPIPDGESALQQIEEAIEGCGAHGTRVIYVQHASLRPEMGIFMPGSHGFDLHPRLRPREEDLRLVKNYPGCFSKTPLEEWLRREGIDTIVISGYMTHMCCDTTAREGFHRDFRVLFLRDATATRDGEHPVLGKIDHQELHRATLIVQASAFARVLPTQELLTSLARREG
jgi:nicotinamidase-related amidase